MNALSTVVTIIGTGVILFNFIFASVLSKSQNSILKVFFICILIALLESVNSIFGIFLPTYIHTFCFPIQNILFLLDSFFWAFFFLKVLKDEKSQKNLKILFGITFTISAYLLYSNNITQVSTQVLAVINICKTIFCILYYRNLFKMISSQNLLRDPIFWIVTGVLLYSCISLPIYCLNNYIRLQFPLLIARNIFSISNMFIIIMNIFFIKAFLCTTSLHKE